MDSSSHLLSSDLFAVVPQGEVSPGPLSDYSYVQSAPLLEILDSTYFELQAAKLEKSKNILKLWEIRLSVLLFTDQLSAAKREATALNNALYLHEHPGAPRPSMPNSAAVSATNIHTNSSRTSLNSSSSKPPLSAFPLPNNNDGHISDSLLLLLLNLKSAPNLARVNEIYRICYQKRLKGGEISPGEPQDLQAASKSTMQTKLMALAYEVVAVLFVSRHYATLGSFLTSIRDDLELLISKMSGEKDVLQRHYSHITFMWILAKVHVRRAGTAWGPQTWGPETWGQLYQKELAKVGDDTWAALSLVANTIAPKIGGNVFKVSLNAETASVENISVLVAEDKISVRTICCVLALWSVAATHNGEIHKKGFSINPQNNSSDLSGLDHTHTFINSKWAHKYNKLYGLE